MVMRNIKYSAALGLAVLVSLAHADPAAPRHLRVGACLSARAMPPPQKGQTAKQYFNDSIQQLKNVAAAFTAKVDAVAVTMDYIVLSSGLRLPSPHDCAQASGSTNTYDVWLELIYDENATFIFEVSQRDGQDLTLAASSPEPSPDATRTRTLLADIGQRIVGPRPRPASPVPLDETRRTNKGIIFVYDTSASMYETDPQARNRLEVSKTIGAILEHNAQNAAHPLPFANVVFADSAQVLDSSPDSKWFQTTHDDFARAQQLLAPALMGMGKTNIGAAFLEVGQLIKSRPDIEHWHVIFFTDGVPTVGITDYHQITQAVGTALAKKSTLSVIALRGRDPAHTEDAKLTELVRATLDDTGQTGEIINLIAGADPRSFQPELERIAFLIDGSTVRDETELKCARELPEQPIRCELDKNQLHALRFGAARKVTFIANTTGLSTGECTAAIENQGLGTGPRTIRLPAGQQSAVLTEAAFRIMLLRGTGRMFVTIEMLDGRLNGDWHITLTLSDATGSEHRP
jgi:Mg-chelatase subunit ChlD